MKPMKPKQQMLCPATELLRDAQIIGIIRPNGEVRFIGRPIPAVGEFRAEARRLGRHAERHFRFAAVCLREDCKRWENGHCTLVDALNRATEGNAALRSQSSPLCGIEMDCQWRLQGGSQACKACRCVGSDARMPTNVRFSAPSGAEKEQAA